MSKEKTKEEVKKEYLKLFHSFKRRMKVYSKSQLIQLLWQKEQELMEKNK